jgi:hypothetical protein
MAKNEIHKVSFKYTQLTKKAYLMNINDALSQKMVLEVIYRLDIT